MLRISFISIILISWISCAFTQVVNITGPSSIEVGAANTYTAVFNSPQNFEVLKFIWNVPFNGEGQAGPSGIEGSIDGMPNAPESYEIITNERQITVPIVWGDFFNKCSDVVNVAVVFTNGSSTQAVSSSFQVLINCLKTPRISGRRTPINRCCRREFQLCERTIGHHNHWDWNVTGGQIISGQGTKCIIVKASLNETIAAGVTISRNENTNIPPYTRTFARQIHRRRVQTPAIEGPKDICLDATYEYCIDPVGLCSYQATMWTVPMGLEILSGQGSKCVQIKVVDDNDRTATIAARVELEGGCRGVIKSHTVRLGKPVLPTLRVRFNACEDEIYIDDLANPSTPDWNWEWTVSGLNNTAIVSGQNPGKMHVLYGPGEIFCVDRIEVSNPCGDISLTLDGFCFETPDCDEEGSIIVGIPITEYDCDEERQCPEGFECVDGKCWPEHSGSCETNGDCPTGYICSNGVCVSADCISDLQCPEGYYCSNGVCIRRDELNCRKNSDCPPEHHCKDGRCVPTPKRLSDQFELDLAVWPNPTSTELTIDGFDDALEYTEHFSVTNSRGKQLMRIDDIQFLKNASINVAQLSSGIYFITISYNDGSTTTMKFVKH